ncbi:hypothetical protein KR222_005949 [Zaprionus bogoriensis]|nr:hypothetical protein KR222_005949 [Zaprionus bogoriensis]
MSFIHPDASLMAMLEAPGEQANEQQLQLRRGAEEQEAEQQFPAQRVNETRVGSSPRDKVEIKIVMLKVQVIRLIKQS